MLGPDGFSCRTDLPRVAFIKLRQFWGFPMTPFRLTAIAACALTLGACAQPPAVSGVTRGADTAEMSSMLRRVAEIRALDARNAADLVEEGRLIYETTGEKRSGKEIGLLSGRRAFEGDFREAIRLASMALYLGRKSNDRFVEGLAHRNIGIAYAFAGDLDSAETHVDESVRLANMVRGGNKNVLRVFSYQMKGLIQRARGDIDGAIRNYQIAQKETFGETNLDWRSTRVGIALAMATTAIEASRLDEAKIFLDEADRHFGEGRGPIMTRVHAELALAGGDYEAAKRLFAESAAAAEEGDDFHLMLAKAGEARALIATGGEEAALTAYLEAIRVAEGIRARFRSEEISSGAFGDAQTVFDEAIDLAMKLGRPALALDISEKSRARAVLDLVRGRVVGRGLDAGIGGAAVSSFAISAGAERAASAQDLQTILPPGMVVAAYHVTGTGAYLWAVRRDGVTGQTLEISPREVRSGSLALRLFAGTARELDGAEFAALGEALLAPLRLRRDETVVVIPHGPLNYVPFAALRTDGGYLVERNAVAFAPSLSLLKTLMEADAASRGSGLIAYANPYAGEGLVSLPGAEAEGAAIAGADPASVLRTGIDASEDSFRREAPGFRTIHVAAHARVDEIDPLYSTVFLAPGGPHDGTLEAREIYDLNIGAADLVTLSACETGLGRVGRGDEQWGFVRTFLAAGAKSVAVSLWDVNDESTRLLMESFYQGYRGGEGRAAALRAAQRAVLVDPATSAPFHWAAFSVWGAPL